MEDSSRQPAQAGRVVCFGELLLRLSPPDQELPFQSPRLEARFGGAEANVAASLALLGQRAAMVSALPDNTLGRACAGELRRHGVDMGGICFAPGRMGLYLLTPGAMQRPAEVLYDRAGSVFACTSPDAYDWPRLLAGAQWLHVSGINLALGEAPAQAALQAMRTARAAGVAVSFDCNHRSSLWAGRAEQASALLRAALEEAQLAFGNDRDLALALGVQYPQAGEDERFAAAATQAFTTFPRLQWLATTSRQQHDTRRHDLLGRLATRETVLATATHQLDGIVDRIGSGDAFAAGMLHGLMRGMDDRAMLDFAVAAACLKHSVPGDVNLLDEQHMLDFIAQAGFDVKR